MESAHTHRRSTRRRAFALLAVAALAALGLHLAGPRSVAATDAPGLAAAWGILDGPRGASATGPQGRPAAWGILDGSTRRLVAGAHVDRERPVASITKLMTAYLALRAGHLHRVVVVPALDVAADEASVGLVAGERVTRWKLLAATVIASGGDAADALAIAVAGSEPAFVRRMNAAARRLGLHRTRYRNATGLDEPGAHSTVRDSLHLAWRLMQDPRFRELARRPSVVVDGRRYAATNPLLRVVPGADGVKTGHTDDAGWGIVGSAWRRGRRMYVCVLGEPDEAARDRDAAALLTGAF